MIVTLSSIGFPLRPSLAALSGQADRARVCPLLAQSGHALLHCMSPLLGVKRTWVGALHMSAFDPKRTCDSKL